MRARPDGVPHRARLLALGLAALVGVSACLGSDPIPTPTAAPSAAAVTPAPTAAADPTPAGTASSIDPAASPAVPDATAGGPTGTGAPSPADGGTPAPTGLATPAVTTPPRAADTLVVVAPSHPTRFLPTASNPAERLLVDLLYDPLYRLDEDLRPVPAVARSLPRISDDGKTWKIPLRVNSRFHDGLAISPEDVAFSLELAASPTCPLGRELCAAVGDHLVGVVANNRNVEITLAEMHAPFLAEALGRLPILSESAVRTATEELLDAADRLGENRPDRVVDAISQQLQRDACVESQPPPGCRLTEHLEELERVIERARMELPSREPFTDETGIFDEDGYAAELLDRMGALAQVLTTAGDDRRAAALDLIDLTRSRIGGGPYRLEGVRDGVYLLQAHDDHAGGAPSIGRVELHIERDASEAVTRLLAGQADWILDVGPEMAPVVIDAPGVVAAPRPLPMQRGVLFNVRPDRLYFDVRARRAFAACLDREALATQLDTERAVATTPFGADTWATPEAEPWPYDPAAGIALLEEAGWEVGEDGIRTKDGVRLSSTIAVRPSSVDVFTFANEAAEQLAGCGIELVVEELDLTGDTMLTQLQWPNEFDTLLLARPLGVDPDTTVRMFESSRITTEDNQADANPSGFTSELADHHIETARSTVDREARREEYAGVQLLLDADIPYWPLWYDTAVAALSTRIRDDEGRIDPSRPRYDWDVARWRLAQP